MTQAKKEYSRKRVTLALVAHKEGSKAYNRFGDQSWAIKPVPEGEPGLPFTTSEDVLNVAKRLVVACLRHKTPTNALWIPALEGDERKGPRDFEAVGFLIKDAIDKGTPMKSGMYGNSIVVGEKTKAKAETSPEVAAMIAEFLK